MAKGKTKAILLAHSAGLVEGNVGGPSWDFIYQVSTIKPAGYDVGDRVALPDGRVFRLGLAKGTIQSEWGAQNNASLLVTYSHPVAGSVGDTFLKVTVAVNTMGISANGVIGKDELRGGFVVIHDQAPSYHVHNRGIVGNSALAVGGTEITLYLDAALTDAPATADGVEVLGNLYRYLESDAGGTYISVVGMPLRDATVGQYLWVQTWGPVWISPGVAGMGGTANERQVVFRYNGTLESQVDEDYGYLQNAGFLIEKSSAGNDACAFIMLQISP